MATQIFTVIGKVVVGLAIVWLVAVFMGYPVKWIINWLFSPSLLVTIFGVPHITFWQAFWLSWLCATLFKGSGSSK